MDPLSLSARERLLSSRAFAALDDGNLDKLLDALTRGASPNAKRNLIETRHNGTRVQSDIDDETLGSRAMKDGKFFAWMMLHEFAKKNNEELESVDAAMHDPLQHAWNILSECLPEVKANLMDKAPEDHALLATLRVLSPSAIEQQYKFTSFHKGCFPTGEQQEQYPIDYALLQKWNEQCDKLDNRDDILTHLKKDHIPSLVKKI